MEYFNPWQEQWQFPTTTYLSICFVKQNDIGQEQKVEMDFPTLQIVSPAPVLEEAFPSAKLVEFDKYAVTKQTMRKK